MDSTAASAARRTTQEHRKEGSGRVSTARPVELAGARTGWAPPRDVGKDEHGMDNMDQFLDIGGAAAGAFEAEEERAVRVHLRVRACARARARAGAHLRWLARSPLPPAACASL
jgi:hypothetical protein